jgi:three-Cys-motif partner protein
MTQHRFGGDWTEVKLAAITAYSKFYTAAISSKFDLWYVDPFAGTGDRVEMEISGGLLEGTPLTQIERTYRGSASRALTIEPPFDHYRFGDKKPSHAAALVKLCKKFPDRDAQVIEGDANLFIQREFSKSRWTNDDFTAGSSRALVFSDPYGLEVQWETLACLAKCQKADVWFLANLGGAVRQICHNHAKLDEGKRRALGQYFGTADWENAFYQTQKGEDLFGSPFTNTERKATKIEVAQFHRRRLESIFTGYVSDPLPLAVGTMDDYFLLYCLSNNPFPAARALIKKGADWVIKKYKQASHRTSAL